jgi:hypothetical protein
LDPLPAVRPVRVMNVHAKPYKTPGQKSDQSGMF